MSQQRIEVSLAGQKITLATSAEHEPLLRAACVLVDEQIQLAINGGNRSIERASMMAALKIAGDLITLQKNPSQQSTAVLCPVVYALIEFAESVISESDPEVPIMAVLGISSNANLP